MPAQAPRAIPLAIIIILMIVIGTTVVFEPEPSFELIYEPVGVIL